MKSEIWEYDSKLRQKTILLDDGYLLRPKYRNSFPAQKILQNLRDKKQWLLCNCQPQGVIMFICTTPKPKFYLKNHSKDGLHHKQCDYHTDVKGEDRAEAEGVISHSLPLSSYVFFPDYAGQALGTNETHGESRINGKSPSKDKLFSLLNLLYEKSFSNVIYPPYQVNAFSQCLALRAKGGTEISMGKFGSVKDNLFIGERGLSMLYSHLKKWRTTKPKERHQAILIMHLAEYSQNIKKGQYELKLSGQTGSLVVGSKTKPMLPGRFNSEHMLPAIAILAFAFENIDSDEAICYRAAIQPIHSSTMLPVDSNYESKFLDALIKECHAQQGNWYIRKPLISRMVDGTPILPDFIIGQPKTSVKKVIEIMGCDDLAYQERKYRTVPLMKKLYGTVFDFDAFKFQNDDKLFAQAASNFINNIFKS